MKFDQDLCLKLWYELNPRVRCAFGNVSSPYVVRWLTLRAVDIQFKNWHFAPPVVSKSVNVFFVFWSNILFSRQSSPLPKFWSSPSKMSKCVHVISRETLSLSFCWYGVFFHLHCCTFYFPCTRNTTQDSTNTIFGEHNYNQVEKSIWECWYWPFSSLSPWLPLKMRYSKNLVKERNQNILLRRQKRFWFIVLYFPITFLPGYLVTILYLNHIALVLFLQCWVFCLRFLLFPSMAPLLL